MSKPVIKLTDVEIYYLTPFYLPGKRRQWEKIKALENINLEVNKGECIALLGDNGAGKSTLLKVIAGILKPDGGTLEVNGQVRILTELGAGFETEASGWENIFIQGALFGFSRKEMKKKAEEIAQFASLGKYLYAPLKVYSDGMYVRLAFSIAVHTEPDIFLVDDIIAVGDIHFQEKCIQRLEKMREEGKTLLIATHSLPLAERLADKGVWIDKGKIVYIGPTEEISNFYLKLSGEKGKAFFLEKGRLKLAFHNGKVFVLWNNRLLTPHYGGYTTIIRNNNAIISPNQKWEIEKHNSHEIIAQSDFLETPISQIWKIKLVSEREWEWEVSMKVRDKSRFEGIETGFLFCEDYKFLWKDGVKEELPFYKGKEWRLLKEESSFSPFHLSTKSSSYPTILWESFLKLHKKRVFLPGEEVRGRAFYWRWGEKEWEPGEHLIFAGRMRFFTSSSLLLSKDEEKGKGIYKVGNREIKICWEGNELTAPGGLSLVLEYKGNTYSPDTSKVSFFSQDTEEIKYTWGNLPFYALFRLRGGKNYLKWRIEIISSEELELKNPRVVLNLLPYPDKWFTLRENGNFSKDFKWFPSTSAFTPFLAVRGKDTPLLLFTIEKDKNIFSFIEKKEDMIILQHFKGYKVRVRKGRQELFEGKVELLSGKNEKKFYIWRGEQAKKSLKELRKQEIREKDISFFMDEGKGRIFYKSREITTQWGLYVSILTQEGWQESLKGVWKVHEEREKAIVAEGKCFFIPLVQRWRIEIKDNGIEWIWEGEKEEEFEVKEAHSSLMLIDKYEEYCVDKWREFPEFEEDWINVWEGMVEKGIEARGKNLPSIIFAGSSPAGIIKNSSSLLKGRVLEYMVDKREMNFHGHIYIR